MRFDIEVVKARDLLTAPFRAKPAHAMSRNDPQANILKYGGGAFYVYGLIVMPATMNANATILSFRWAVANQVAVIERVLLQVQQSAAATATILSDVRCFRAIGFTASDTGGTALTPVPKDSNMAGSNITDLRQSAGGAAGLTVGTRTVDPFPLCATPIVQTITTINTQPYGSEWHQDAASKHPLVLNGNASEGLIVRNTAAFGAAGSAVVGVMIEWTEYPQPNFGP